MLNKKIFIDSYLEKIQGDFLVNRDDAFEIFSIATFLGKSFEEIFENILISGSRDGGFDGVYYDESDNLCTAYFFQCKNTQSLKDNEIQKFKIDYQQIFQEDNRISRALNSEMTLKLQEYKDFAKARVIIEPKLCFIYNGENNSTSNSNNSSIFNSNNNSDDFLIIDSDYLYNQIKDYSRGGARKENKFVFSVERSNIAHPSDPQSLISYSIENIRSLTFKIPAIQICELIDKEIRENRKKDYLFSENIRGFLGKKKKANMKMIETLNGEDAVYFPFYNNGITMISSGVNIPRLSDNRYNIEITDPVIVNGLQTSEILYDFYINPNRRERLKDVDVLVKVCETRDKDIIRKITEATNTQSSINYADQLSTSQFNQRVLLYFNNKGVGYLTKVGETFQNRENANYAHHIEQKNLIKIWYSTFFESPEATKVSLEKILERIFEATRGTEKNLSSIFKDLDESPITLQLYIAYLIYNVVMTQKKVKIESKKGKRIIEDDFLSTCDELMAYGIYKYISTNDLEFEKQEIIDTYTLVYQGIKKIVEKKKKEYRDNGLTYSHNNYFKSNISRYELNRYFKITEIESEIELIDRIKNYFPKQRS